jgi:hypothetical protein
MTAFLVMLRECRRLTRTTGSAGRMSRATGAPIIAALVLTAVCVLTSTRGRAEDQPMIDPDVRALTSSKGTARVVVELRVPGGDRAVITRTQDEVLARLAGTGARLARRYATVPMLVLEIDATGLARLADMGSLVARVRVDALADPTVGPTPRR